MNGLMSRAKICNHIGMSFGAQQVGYLYTREDEDYHLRMKTI